MVDLLRILFPALLPPLVLALSACAATTTIEPIGADSVRFHAGIGGPIVGAFDTYIPMPNPSVGAVYGLRDDLNLTGTMHLLGLPYGIISADLGAVWFPLVDDGGTTIGVHPRMLVMVSVKSGVEERLRIYPAVSATAAWPVGTSRLYAGADLVIPLSNPDYDPAPESVVLSPFVGYRWRLGTRVNLFTEVKWHGVNVVTDATADYANPGGRGAIAPFIAVDFAW